MGICGNLSDTDMAGTTATAPASCRRAATLRWSPGALRFGETLLLEGLIPSIGTVGDALDNALAKTTIGL